MTYWKAKLKDGREVTENESKWSDVSDQISELGLVLNNGIEIKLPSNMEKYAQAKSASATIGSDNIEIESRYIGIFLGNNIVKIRVDEKTNNISLEVG